MLSIRSPREMALELGARVRELRLLREWTRAELASRSGVTEASLKRFELTGQVSLERLLQVSFTMGLLDEFDKLLLPTKPTSMKELKSMSKKRERGRRRT